VPAKTKKRRCGMEKIEKEMEKEKMLKSLMEKNEGVVCIEAFGFRGLKWIVKKDGKFYLVRRKDDFSSILEAEEIEMATAQELVKIAGWVGGTKTAEEFAKEFGWFD
jgi:hypothetical protein